MATILVVENDRNPGEGFAPNECRVELYRGQAGDIEVTAPRPVVGVVGRWAEGDDRVPA